jgi:hypothetical protein
LTIAIGIQLAAPAYGAVLVTDALVQLGSPTGSQALLCMTPRFHQLEPCDGLAIVFQNPARADTSSSVN